MEIQLSPELEDIVRSRVAAGEFDTPSAFVEQALQFVLDQGYVEDWPLEELQHEVQLGRDDIANGRVSAITADSVKAQMRQLAGRVRPDSTV